MLVAVGLIQMVWAVLVAVGLLVPTDRVDGDGWGVIVLVIAIFERDRLLVQPPCCVDAPHTADHRGPEP